MKIITVTNQKGGAGKTSITMNLGVALALTGKKILLIDLDPQANLTYSFGINDPKNTIVEVLQGKQTLQTILVKRKGLILLLPLLYWPTWKCLLLIRLEENS